MFKIWIDRKGTVHTLLRGSLAQQHKDLVKVLKHLQERVSESERIVADTNDLFMRTQRKESADAIRREADEIGILQARKK
jgi:ABC-type proline/glycine betaine transport system substrate-binding protein